jgi:hypothetical protein
LGHRAHLENPTMKNKALTVILIGSLLGNAALAYSLLTRDTIDYKSKYTALKSSYISLATAQKYSLETFFKAQTDFKSLMPEYKDTSKEEFEEAMRRKIIKLEMEIKDLQKE